jgi:hypothetical protein
MGFGGSIVLIATGAILTWGVTAEIAGVNVQVAGVILLVVGVAGFLVSLRFWSSWGGPATIGRRRSTSGD